MVRAVHHLVRDRKLAAGAGLWHWADTPCVLRCPEADQRAGHPHPGAPTLCADNLARKLDACCAHTTQFGFQFGGETAMRDQLTQWMHRVGERFTAGAAPVRC